MGTSVGCSRQAPVNFEPAAAMRAITSHLATFYPASPSRAGKPSTRPPALDCPSANNCHPPSRGPKFGGAYTSIALQPATRSTACFAGKPTGTTDKPVNDIGSLSTLSPVRLATTVAALPAAAGILRSTAHSAMQGGGERSQVSAHSSRESTTLHNCRPIGQRKTAQTQADTDVKSKQRQANSAPVSSVYALGVGRVALSTASIGGKSTHELFNVAVATAAAQGARDGGEPAIKAAFPPHCVASKQESVAKPQQARLQRAQFQSDSTRQDELPSGRSDDPTSHTIGWVIHPPTPNRLGNCGITSQRRPRAKNCAKPRPEAARQLTI